MVLPAGLVTLYRPLWHCSCEIMIFLQFIMLAMIFTFCRKILYHNCLCPTSH